VTSFPYPHGPTRMDKERQYKMFLDMIKRLHINVPFTETMEQMPRYGKFIKDLHTKKRRIGDEETRVL